MKEEEKQLLFWGKQDTYVSFTQSSRCRDSCAFPWPVITNERTADNHHGVKR